MAPSDIASLVGLAGSGRGKVYRLLKPGTSIGSSRQAEIQVTGPLVSELHAVIERSNDGAFMLRNRSPHGTFVNRARVDVHALRAGDRIQVGEGGLFEFQLSAAGKSATGGAGKAKASPKTVLIGIGIAVYLAGMGAFIVVLAGRSGAPPGISASSLAPALAATRAQLLSKDSLHASGAAVGAVASGADPGAEYFALTAAVARGDPPEELARRADNLLEAIGRDFQDARILEQQERYHEARIIYRRILDTAPDSRLPISNLAAQRLKKLGELDHHGK